MLFLLRGGPHSSAVRVSTVLLLLRAGPHSSEGEGAQSVPFRPYGKGRLDTRQSVGNSSRLRDEK